jgi:hypothetical protein
LTILCIVKSRISWMHCTVKFLSQNLSLPTYGNKFAYFENFKFLWYCLFNKIISDILQYFFRHIIKHSFIRDSENAKTQHWCYMVWTIFLTRQSKDCLIFVRWFRKRALNWRVMVPVILYATNANPQSRSLSLTYV